MCGTAIRGGMVAGRVVRVRTRWRARARMGRKRANELGSVLEAEVSSLGQGAANLGLDISTD